MQQIFTLGVTRLAVVYQEIKIAAASPEDAAKRALKEAKEFGTDGWEVDDVYDDGKPHCEICVSSCRDEAGEQHEVTGASIMP